MDRPSYSLAAPEWAAGRRICILGFGREGRAALAALAARAPRAELAVADRVPPPDDPGVPVFAGPDYLERLEAFDLIVKSPGVPPLPELEPLRDRLTSPTQLFFDTIEGTGARVVGVTGSKGKSTTSSLIHAALRAAGREAWLVGNIGRPALEYLDRAREGVLFVHELSSYQLADLVARPDIAVVTAFFPEHLDYHGSLEAYLEAKKRIARFQRETDVVLYNAASPECAAIAAESPGRRIPFSPEEAPLPLEATRLRGVHNLANMAAAARAAALLGVPEEAIRTAFREFPGLPHRLQSLGLRHGIEWVDDAISTTPESTIAALDALGDRVATLLLGGQDRGYDFTRLGQRIAASSVRHAILFPETGRRIREAIEAAGGQVAFHEVQDMRTAVRLARAHTPPGRICLLSSASPSYNLFANFEERGRAFAECVFGE